MLLECKLVADGIPYDGKPMTVVTALFLPVTVVFDLLASTGIVFALACFIFNFIYRNHKYVTIAMLIFL